MWGGGGGGEARGYFYVVVLAPAKLCSTNWSSSRTVLERLEQF